MKETTNIINQEVWERGKTKNVLICATVSALQVSNALLFEWRAGCAEEPQVVLCNQV